MNLNRETAMRLWRQSFGRETKVKDFTGRMMAKGAYNDRNSEFGWNVDHILPQSRGGATADHNLVCCHIQTNDEKADRFPCFTANGIAFEIIRVQNHYEIRPKNKDAEQNSDENEWNPYDSAAGIRLFKSLNRIQNKKRFVGTLFIYLYSLSTGAVVDFIEKIFDTENISFDTARTSFFYSSNRDIRITVHNYDMPCQSDVDELLDKCVLLNTYLSAYFLECNYISGFNIFYRGDYFDRKEDLFKIGAIEEPHDARGYFSRNNSLYINERIRINTDAKNEVDGPRSSEEYIEYDRVFTRLQKNLMKEADRR